MAISGIHLNGDYYSVLVNGRKVSDLHRATVGDFCGHSTKIVIFKMGDSYLVYDKSGKRLKDFHEPTVGKFLDATDRSLMFMNADRIDTYDLSGKKICSRNHAAPEI